MLANLRSRFTGQYWLGLIPGLLVLIYRDFIPKYLTDDPVRVVSIRRVFDPSFLSHEWLQLAGYDEDRLTILFKILFAPLWLLFRQGIPVALCARVIVWVIVFAAMVRLARAIHVPRYGLAIGLFYWIEQGQSMGAGEWILGGAEGKCLAYAALMLALESLVRGKRTLAAVLCGSAFWFHVPVALWGVLAIYGAILCSQRDRPLRDFLRSAFITVIISLPMAWIAWKYAGVAALAGGYPSTDWLIVVFRNPHHLDPQYFGGLRALLKLLVCSALVMLGLKTMVPSATRRMLSAFAAVLVMEFSLGLVARQLGFLWYLKTYPFRVSDVFVFFLCCLILPKFIVDVLSSSSISRPIFTTPTRRAVAAVLVLTVFAGCTLSIGLVRSDKFFVRQFVSSWSHFLRHDTNSYLEMTGWIRRNTQENSLIIAPPWMDDFPLEAERAPVVSFRRNPHNGLVQEWYRRYCAMNGGSFHGVGLNTLPELQKNFKMLSLSQLQNIRRLYGGEYYLTQAKRTDLAPHLVHENGDYYLYSVPSY